MKRKSGSTEITRLVGLVTAVVVVASLYLGRAVFIPLALALLISILLSPVVGLLEALRAPRILAILLIVFVLGGLLGFVAWKASLQVTSLANELPTYRRTLEQKIHVLRALRNPNLNRASATVDELEREIVNMVPGAPSEGRSRTAYIPGYSAARPMTVEVVPPSNPVETVRSLLSPLAAIGMVVIFTIFMLMGREDLRNRFIHLAGGGRLTVVTHALDDAASRIHRYLLLQSLVNVGFGVTIGIVLHFIGIPNGWLWGLIAAILRFLPYVGPPLAALMPVLLSLAIFPGWGHTFATIGFFFVLELIVANLVEPLLYGAHLGLSALAILVAAVFWTLIWGLPGLLLSTPLTVCVVVLGRYVPSWNFLSVLLGDGPALSPPLQYYQRLLAGDQGEARHVLEQYLRTRPMEDLLSEVLIPALSLAKQDRYREELDEATQNFVYQSIRETIEEFGDGLSGQTPNFLTGSPAPDVDSLDTRSLDVLCVPAKDDADSIVALLLSQLLEARGFRARSLSLSELPETLLLMEKSNPAVVCISALPPFAIEHARVLYQKLQQPAAGPHIIVCLWHFDGDAQKISLRLKLEREDEVLTTLSQVLQHVAARAATPA